jgi:hypothetical protein
MSVLEPLDTITGADNNWVDGIGNDDPIFPDQNRGRPKSLQRWAKVPP